VIAAHPAVAECAVIARADDLGGQEPIRLVVLKSGMTITATEL
jgi:propionyl-CoA synthetase